MKKRRSIVTPPEINNFNKSRKLDTFIRWCPFCRQWKPTVSENMVKCKDCQSLDKSKRMFEKVRDYGRMPKKGNHGKYTVITEEQKNKLREKLGW